MAVYAYDTTTGKPLYNNDITAPATQFQEAADFAERVGPQSVATYADLSTVPFKRPGMKRMVGPVEYVYVDSTTGWLKSFEDTNWQTFTLGAGWTFFGVPWATPRVRRVNGVIHIKGLVRNGGTTVGTLPTGFRPLEYTEAQFNGLVAGSFALAYIQTDGAITIQGYAGGASNAGIDIRTSFLAEA
jgi:hypothetical protein